MNLKQYKKKRYLYNKMPLFYCPISFSFEEEKKRKDSNIVLQKVTDCDSSVIYHTERKCVIDIESEKWSKEKEAIKKTYNI